MAKLLVLAAAAMAMSVSASAMALDTRKLRDLQVDGFLGWNSSLGTAQFTALGRSGQYCEYLMSWESPFNPNDVQVCVVREMRTPSRPSCIRNEYHDFVSIVLGGPAAATYCAGFNLMGADFENVTLMFGESPWGLHGVAIFPGYFPVVYPVLSNTIL